MNINLDPLPDHKMMKETKGLHWSKVGTRRRTVSLHICSLAFYYIFVHFIPRLYNPFAHFMAQMGKNYDGEMFWFDHFLCQLLSSFCSGQVTFKEKKRENPQVGPTAGTYNAWWRSK